MRTTHISSEYGVSFNVDERVDSAYSFCVAISG